MCTAVLNDTEMHRDSPFLAACSLLCCSCFRKTGPVSETRCMASDLERNSFAASTERAAAWRWISEHNFCAVFCSLSFVAPFHCSLFRCLILRMYGTVTMKRALCLNSWWGEGSGPMSYLPTSKTHCRVPLFFKLKQKKHVSSSLFYKCILNSGFTCCLCVLCSFDKLGVWEEASFLLSIFILFI